MCRSILPDRTDDQLLDISHQRLVDPVDDEAHTHELLAIDGAIEVLDVRDHKRLHEEQKTAVTKSSERHEYSFAYQAKRAAVRSAREPAAAPKKKGKAKPSGYPPKIPSTIPQADARLFVPPGASIWRALQRPA
jgi:hypothetical protein